MSLFKQLIVKSEDKESKEEDFVVEETDNKELEEEKVSEESKADEIQEVEEAEEKEEADTNVVKKIRVFDTSPNEDFWFHYGPVVKNLAELREALLQIDDELYEYHSKKEDNDFERWIRDVFGYEELAKKVGSAKTRKKAYKILEDAVE